MSAHKWRPITAIAGVTLLMSGCGVGLQDLPVGGARNTIDVVAQVDTADGVVDVMPMYIRPAGDRTGHRRRAHREGVELTLSLDKSADLPQNVTATSRSHPRWARRSCGCNRRRRRRAACRPARRSLRTGPRSDRRWRALLRPPGNVLSGSGMTQLQSVMASLNTAFANRSDKVADLIATLNRLLARSSHYNADFNRAMTAAADATARWPPRQQQVEAFLGETPRAVSVLANPTGSDRGADGADARIWPPTSTPSPGADRTNSGSLVPDAAKLVDSLAAFNSGVGATLANMNSFMANFSRAIRGDYLVFDGALDIPGGIDKIITEDCTGVGSAAAHASEIGDILSGGLWRDRTHPAPTRRPGTAKKPATGKKPATSKEARDEADADRLPTGMSSVPDLPWWCRRLSSRWGSTPSPARRTSAASCVCTPGCRTPSAATARTKT